MPTSKCGTNWISALAIEKNAAASPSRGNRNSTSAALAATRRPSRVRAPQIIPRPRLPTSSITPQVIPAVTGRPDVKVMSRDTGIGALLSRCPGLTDPRDLSGKRVAGIACGGREGFVKRQCHRAKHERDRGGDHDHQPPAWPEFQLRFGRRIQPDERGHVTPRVEPRQSRGVGAGIPLILRRRRSPAAGGRLPVAGGGSHRGSERTDVPPVHLIAAGAATPNPD